MLCVLAVISSLTFLACDKINEDLKPDSPVTQPEPEPEVTELTVVTGEFSNVTENSATASISITSDGGASITACGIVWDEEPNPTEDLPTKVTFDGTEKQYTCQLTGLKASTTYQILPLPLVYVQNSA